MSLALVDIHLALEGLRYSVLCARKAATRRVVALKPRMNKHATDIRTKPVTSAIIARQSELENQLDHGYYYNYYQ